MNSNLENQDISLFKLNKWTPATKKTKKQNKKKNNKKQSIE